LLAIFGLVLALTSFAVPVLAATTQTPPPQSTKDRCDAFKAQFGLSNGVNIIGGSKVFCSGTELLTWGLNLLLGFSGTITMIFLIIGGYMLLTSGGNEEQAEKGKKILTNSLIGLVVILMAAAIVRIVAGLLQ